MTMPQRYFVVVAAVGIVSIASWLTISSGMPQIYAPMNLLVLIPFFALSALFNDSWFAWLGIAPLPIFFCFWCWPVFRGRTTLPTRSMVLFVLAVVLSAIDLVSSARYGIKYQSMSYVIGVTVINVACWTLLGVLAFLARRRPSWGLNLGFHITLFAWLAWYAFPYLGELP